MHNHRRPTEKGGGGQRTRSQQTMVAAARRREDRRAGSPDRAPRHYRVALASLQGTRIGNTWIRGFLSPSGCLERLRAHVGGAHAVGGLRLGASDVAATGITAMWVVCAHQADV
jgi:hypothetical protein